MHRGKAVNEASAKKNREEVDGLFDCTLHWKHYDSLEICVKCDA